MGRKAARAGDAAGGDQTIGRDRPESKGDRAMTEKSEWTKIVIRAQFRKLIPEHLATEEGESDLFRYFQKWINATQRQQVLANIVTDATDLNCVEWNYRVNQLAEDFCRDYRSRWDRSK